MRLHVNVDHVATLRNARGAGYPDPIRAALVCIEAGAHGITAHLREDRRHITDDDVKRLREVLRVPFNFEMAATDEMVAIACKTHPEVVTLVPERRQERTTEGGLDVVGGGARLAAHVARLQGEKIKVSLFIAPDVAQVEASQKLGVEQIELHTGEYAHAQAKGEAETKHELDRLAAASQRGHAIGLEIAAGHGLTVANVPALVRIPEIIELNIGHAIISDAVFLGLDGAVRAMATAIAKGRPA